MPPAQERTVFRCCITNHENWFPDSFRSEATEVLSGNGIRRLPHAAKHIWKATLSLSQPRGIDARDWMQLARWFNCLSCWECLSVSLSRSCRDSVALSRVTTMTVHADSWRSHGVKVNRDCVLPQGFWPCPSAASCHDQAASDVYLNELDRSTRNVSEEHSRWIVQSNHDPWRVAIFCDARVRWISGPDTSYRDIGCSTQT
jgi:hypothetical protein